MKDSLILEHKKYISAKQASSLVGYTSDYVGQLCRENKIESKMVGRTWFVSEESILNHKISNLKKTIDPKFQEILNIKGGVNSSDLVTENKNVNQNESDIKDIVKNEEVKNVQENVNVASSVKSEINFIDTRKTIQSYRTKNISKILPPISSLQINSGSSIALNAPSLPLVSTKYKNNFSKNSENSFELNSVLPSKKILLSVAMVVVIILNIFILKNIFISSKTVASQTSGSIVSLKPSTSLTTSVISGIADFSKSLLSYFGFGNNKVALNQKSSLSSNDSVSVTNTNDSLNGVIDKKFDGIAVVPSLGQSDKQEAIKNNIRNTFSDEVEVIPDNSGTSGVITPVFKKVSKENYVYVLVPEVKKK